ncbi:MAG: ATP-dependent DNA helicase RecG [Candidatus Sungbacteria bacterium]|nr:ATP-dependent DNA helicase RecG [Candidatus Sungbacteria bacterium]
MLLPETPIEKIPRMNANLARKLHRLGIKTLRDLIFHFPFRYDDFTNVKEIADVKIGEVATVRAVLKKITSTRAWKKRMFLAEATVEDDSGTARVVWFNQPYLAKTFRVGEVLSISGKLTKSPRGAYFANPAYERVGMKEGLTHTGGLVPVYPETAALSSRWIRFLVKEILPISEKIPESLPDNLRRKYKFLPIAKALTTIHFPKSMKDAEEARRRFAFEEILLIQLRVLRERRAILEKKSPEIPVDLALIKKFVSSLPFPLTNAQRKSAWEIVNNTAKPHPMNRLLEGDVGSGKTVVAALASLNAVAAGFQVAYLAPTEILALQHFSTFKNLLAGFDISLGLLTAAHKKLFAFGGVSKKVNVAALAGAGESDIIIGTHAVIQDKVQFKKLGLVIVDEQHRFGVKQRAKLQQQATSDKRQERNSSAMSHVAKPMSLLVPHFLSMTATPIPRTLALTVYGDLDVSLLDEIPEGRKPIMTRIVPSEKRAACYEFIRKEVRAGRQVFVICPRIEIATSDMGPAYAEASVGRPETRQTILKEEVKAVKTEYEKLSKQVFPDLKITMLHGKIKPKEKEKIMREFRDGKFDILVSTSVVEVGVDVPNATVMLIDGAEKFGLAQIHQFRGRVGRAEHQSYCFLMTTTPEAESSSRLKAVVSAKNGFELAEKDLAIRGPGDFLGTRQSGIPPFAYKSFTDMKLIQSARETAGEIISKDSKLEHSPELKKRLAEFEQSVHWE